MRATCPTEKTQRQEPVRRSKGCYLTTTDLHRLDLACGELAAFARLDGGYGGVYLVGSAGERPDFRDVDVRLILMDETFDALFGRSPILWSMFCYAVSRQLAADTGLPIDFQVQRCTEANEYTAADGHHRNPLGIRRIRDFAGLGDATKFDEARPRDIFEALGMTDDQRKHIEDQLRQEYARIAASERAAALINVVIGSQGAPHA